MVEMADPRTGISRPAKSAFHQWATAPGDSMRHLAALILLGTLAACAGSGGDITSSLMPVEKPTLTSTTSTSTVTVAYPRFDDSNPHDWGSAAPWKHAVHGTDVSKYNGPVDWRAARANGVSFAFVKATEGGDRLDDLFALHWAGARQAGVPRAAYHFFYFCRPAAEQAAWFIRNVPRERGALPPVLDMEWNPQSPTCKLRPSPATVRSEMRTFLSLVERHYGKKPIIYTSVDFYEDNDLGSFKGYPFWLRSVAGHPTRKYGAQPYTFWQYTGTGVVPGMKGNVDLNVFNGSTGEWQKWLAKHAA